MGTVQCFCAHFLANVLYCPKKPKKPILFCKSAVPSRWCTNALNRRDLAWNGHVTCLSLEACRKPQTLNPHPQPGMSKAGMSCSTSRTCERRKRWVHGVGGTIYTHTYIYIYVCVYMYIYIYRVFVSPSIHVRWHVESSNKCITDVQEVDTEKERHSIMKTTTQLRLTMSWTQSVRLLTLRGCSIY